MKTVKYTFQTNYNYGYGWNGWLLVPEHEDIPLARAKQLLAEVKFYNSNVKARIVKTTVSFKTFKQAGPYKRIENKSSTISPIFP